jgi:hypothetical protein
MRKADSSVGEYFPCSIAATVWRVTPIFSPNSAWVISPARKRSVRIMLVRRRPSKGGGFQLSLE